MASFKRVELFIQKDGFHHAQVEASGSRLCGCDGRQSCIIRDGRAGAEREFAAATLGGGSVWEWESGGDDAAAAVVGSVLASVGAV